MNAPANDPDPRETPRRLSLGKRLAFAAATLLLFLGTTEVAARIAGFGDPDALGGSPLALQWVYPPLFRATRDGKGYRPTDRRMVDRFFPARKTGADPLRIFVFGESAVAGVGYGENGSFSRALERRLAAAGVRDVSVVNLGIRVIAARQVHFVERELLKTLRRREGIVLSPRDVCVFYVGNNEFLHLNAERYRERAHGGLPFSVRADRALESFRLYTGLKGLSRSFRERMTPTLRAAWPGAQNWVEPLLGAREIEGAVANHAAQLRGMVEDARAAGATPVLATVATNMEWSANEAPREGWLVQACGGSVPEDPSLRREKLEAAERAASAELVRPGATQLERWRARLRRAHVRRALGRVEDARADFLAAYGEDDLYHLRCLPVMNENVRKLAAELHVPLADAEASLAAVSSDGITGYPLVYDNVHLTLSGNERVALEVHRALAAASLVPPLPAGAAYTPLSDARCLATGRDALAIGEWLGWTDDRSFFANPDCERSETLRRALDEKIAAGKATPEELVWAANGYAFQVGGEPRARELYAQARAKAPALAAVIDANLAWLDARPD